MEFDRHDLAKERPPRELLERLASRYGVAAILNPRSPAFKALGVDAASIAPAEAIRMIEEDPNMMRRPLLVKGSDAVFGWDADAMGTLIR